MTMQLMCSVCAASIWTLLIQIVSKENSWQIQLTIGCHRCTAQGYPGAVRDDSLLSCTAEWVSSFTCKNKCAHKYFLYIVAIDEYWQVMYKCHVNSRTIYFTICNSPLRYYCNSVQGRPAVVPTLTTAELEIRAKSAAVYKHCSPVTSGWLAQSCDWRCSCSVVH